MDIDFARQVELTGFPAGVHVTAIPDGSDQLLRVTQDHRGVELLLTAGAMNMYGTGPSLALALTRLKEVAGQGLPARATDGTFERLVFLGD